MDTTQKPREEAGKRRQPAPSGERRRPRPEGAPAQNGERKPRPAEDSRKKAAETRQPVRQQSPRPEQERRRAPAENAEKTANRPASQKPRSAGTSAPRKRPDDRKSAPKAAGKRRPPAGSRSEDLSDRKRAYGKSKPKKKSAVVSLMESIEQSTKKSAEKRKKRKAGRSGQPAPAVIYTQPAVFNRNRLIVQLITVTAIVLALVIGLSVFFKVEHIYVSGAEVYSESSIIEVCGVSKGDNLLTFSHARAAALIQANRPYVREVRFGIKLPDTVNIIIEEDDVVYAIKDQTGQWWLMNSTGRVVEQGNNAKVANKTQVLGVTLQDPVPNERGVAMEGAPAAADATADTTPDQTAAPVTPVTTTGAQRLDAALQILKALEDNDIVGAAASVDVSRIDDIILWYGTRYQVNLGDNARLDHKVACMNAVIAQMSEYQSGILDCSFTIWPNQVGYTPFS